MKSNFENYIFAIDEPEISLHPMQQRKFAEILQNVSESYNNIQIIITTHSPYVVKTFGNDNVNNIKILKKNGNTVDVDTLGEKMINYGSGSTYISLNEINYRAFDEASEEYHQELFGYIQSRLGCTVDQVDVWLFEQHYAERKTDEYDFYFVDQNNGQLRPDDKGGYQHHEKTLPYCVRNQIDHPNIKNQRFSEYHYIRESIKIMVNAIKDIPKMGTKFRIIPNDDSIKKLSKTMTIEIETKLTLNPFYSDKNLENIRNKYKEIYSYDYKKNGCCQNDFYFESIS